MKLSKRTMMAVCLVLAVALLATGCAANKSPYAKNDADNYTVSVRFDANGGLFATNTSVITDSFNISGMQKNANGEVELALITPDDPIRDREGFEPYYSGYFLAGWYAERTQVSENEYTYSKKWDFSKDRLTVAAGGDYSSNEPVLTLYAVWIPSFTIEYYDLDSGELLDTKNYNPMTSNGIVAPQWDEGSGKIDMNDFPKRKGYTFNGVYLDAEGTIPATDEVIAHCGIVDVSNGTGSNGTMKLYVDWIEGDWYHIYTAKQFNKLADTKGNYVICADLDFSDVKWPNDLTKGTFTGTIQGNGYSFNNILAPSKPLFMELGDSVNISDLTFGFVTEEGETLEDADMDLVCDQIGENAVLSNVNVGVSSDADNTVDGDPV